MKAPTRVPLFSYETIATTLLMTTKSLEIKFRKNHLTMQALCELEEVLTWAASHTEVQSIFITNYGNTFINDLDPELLSSLSATQVQNFYKKLSTIAQSFFCLSQTIVIDMKKGAHGAALELCLAADMRVATSDATFSFNHLENGLIPSCGLFSFMRPFINQNVLRSLVLSGATFDRTGLLSLGSWCDFDTNANTLLERIFNQPSVARMQTKRGLYASISSSIKKDDYELETQLFNAVIQTGDYTKQSPFLTSKEFKEVINNSSTL